MQQESAPLDSRPDPTSFAGLLASLATAKPQKTTDWLDDSAGNLDGFEDDVATLSYERALKTHARYKPDTSEPSGIAIAENLTSWSAPASGINISSPAGPAGHNTDPDQNRKCASVTVRMSKAEAMQLQQRAAEAGMTVSAYLRSCTFEVEALRTQVKQALIALRAAQTAPNAPSKTSPTTRALAAPLSARDR